MHSFCPGYIVENLELFHSKYYVPLGEPAAVVRAQLVPLPEPGVRRHRRPDVHGAARRHGAADPAVPRRDGDLVGRTCRSIPIVQAPALVPFNSTYWTGWPTAEDPWNMPVSWWATFNLVINGYPNPETGEWVGGIKPAGARVGS